MSWIAPFGFLTALVLIIVRPLSGLLRGDLLERRVAAKLRARAAEK